MTSDGILRTQTAALVHKLGGDVDFKTDYPVPKPGPSKSSSKFSIGVRQSNLHAKNGTAASAIGDPITKINLPHVGGHERVGPDHCTGP